MIISKVENVLFSTIVYKSANDFENSKAPSAISSYAILHCPLRIYLKPSPGEPSK